MLAAVLAVVDPGDEVIVFEPFYENYGPDAVLSGARRRYVPLRAARTGASIRTSSRRPSAPRTRAIIVNTPHNPTGKVFTRAELEHDRRALPAVERVAITDEIYEHIVYEGEHVPHRHACRGCGTARSRSAACRKTYSVTGWRLGYMLAPERADACPSAACTTS